MYTQRTKNDGVIDIIKKAYQVSEKPLIEKKVYNNHDEFLDDINELKSGIEESLARLRDVNDSIEKLFPSDQPEAEVLDLKASMHSLHSSISMQIEKMRADDITNKCFSNLLSKIEEECKQLQEYINDINDYILNNDDDWGDDDEEQKDYRMGA